MSLRLTPLAAALALAFLAPFHAYAQTPSNNASNASDTVLPTVTVDAEKDQSSPGKSYAGGKIKTGGKLGVLGNQDSMNVPFSVVSYTAEGIQNQQAKSIGEVLASDPTVRTGLGYGNFSESFTIRGFTLSGDSVSYDGLYGITPRQLVAVESLDRIELLRGSSAFLYGVTPDGTGIGGAINLMPKRATDAPISQVTVDYTGKSRLGAQVDLGRRFGPENQIGIRINALVRDGEGSIDKEKRNTRLLSIGSDFKTGNLRLSADLTYQREAITQGRSTAYTSTTVTTIPGAPSASTNWAQPWTYSNLENTFGLVRGEYDFNSQVTGYAAAGFQQSNEFGVYSSPTLTNNTSGNGTAGILRTLNNQSSVSIESGLRFKLDTGPIKHQANLSVSEMQKSQYTGFDFGSASYSMSSPKIG